MWEPAYPWAYLSAYAGYRLAHFFFPRSSSSLAFFFPRPSSLQVSSKESAREAGEEDRKGRCVVIEQSLKNPSELIGCS